MRQEWTLLDFFRATFTLPLVLIFIFVGMVNSLVDNLLTIDIGHINEDFPDIKKVILVSSDTDFCPPIRDIKKRYRIEVILYTYFDKKRKSKFSLSNELIDCCSNCFKLIKEDFTSCPIKKQRNKK